MRKLNFEATMWGQILYYFCKNGRISRMWKELDNNAEFEEATVWVENATSKVEPSMGFPILSHLSLTAPSTFAWTTFALVGMWLLLTIPLLLSAPKSDIGCRILQVLTSWDMRYSLCHRVMSFLLTFHLRNLPSYRDSIISMMVGSLLMIASFPTLLFCLPKCW